MSWYVFWILDLPLKEASGDSEDRVQEVDNSDDTCRLDENDNGSCCGGGGGNGNYNSGDDDDDDDRTEVWFFSKEVLKHKGEGYNEISLKEVEAADDDDEESRQQRLRDDAKEFWEGCIAHGY